MVANKCVHPAADTFTALYGNNFGSLLQPEASNAVGWAQALLKGSVPPVRPVAPVIIYWGSKDVTVPPVMGELYRAQMCKLGGNVARVELAGEQTHYTTRLSPSRSMCRGSRIASQASPPPTAAPAP